LLFSLFWPEIISQRPLVFPQKSSAADYSAHQKYSDRFAVLSLFLRENAGS
jgi:hypothetical protein